MDCRLCEQPITNPLCQDCLGTAVEQWLQQQAPEKIEDLQRETASMRDTRGIKCIGCKHAFTVCPYCYVKEVFNLLGEGRLQIRFLKYFNFLT